MQRFDQYNFSGKKALVRVDFNVPLNANLEISDDTRIRAAMPTLKKILSDGGAVIIMSHLGRPKNGPEKKFSLLNIKQRVAELLEVPVQFAADCIGAEAHEIAAKLRSGEVLLLENLRFYKQEQAGNESFAKSLSEMGDVYVNDAFGTAHRAHASTAIIAKFFPKDKLFGLLMETELRHIDKLLHDAKKPFTAIMGGAKVSTKITIIERLLPKIDHLIIGGGMTYTFVKANGGNIGNSLVEDDKLNLARQILARAETHNVAVHIATDTAISNTFSADGEKRFCPVNEIPDGWMGLDIGPETEKHFAEIIKQSKTILWNGPAGVFEFDNFAHGTRAIADALVAATENGAYTLVGGGDSVAAINKFNLADKVSYVSTGGGALLEYMEGIDLPGIKAIRG